MSSFVEEFSHVFLLHIELINHQILMLFGSPVKLMIVLCTKNGYKEEMVSS